MHRLAVGTLVSTLLAVSLIVVGGTGTAAAAVCSGGGVLLCNGTVDRTSGTTATTFTFSVVYQNANPDPGPTVQVVIDGSNAYTMTGPGGPDYSAGVTFSYAMKLAVGTHTYSFTGVRGGGTKVHTDTPSPNTIVVGPAPTPTPTPTPTATVAAVEATPSASPSPAATPSPTATATGSRSTPSGLGAGPVSGGPGGQGGGPGQLAPWLAVALAAAGGLLLFGAWRRRRKPDDGLHAPLPIDPVPPLAPDAAIVTPPPPTPKVPRAPRLRRLGRPVIDDPVPELALAPAAALGLEAVRPDEATLPRWRRPSLKAARLNNERKPVETVPLAFGAAATGATTERRRVRYAVVPLVDAPDEIRSTEIGQLQEGDEVELLSSEGRWMRVRTPVGTIGWVHKTTLAPLGTPAPASLTRAADADDEVDGSGLLDAAILRASAVNAVPQPAADPAPKPRRTPRGSRGTAPAG